MVYKPTNITGGPHPVRLAPGSFPSDFSIAEMHSYGHLLVITGYKWDYTFYKWGFLSTYNW